MGRHSRKDRPSLPLLMLSGLMLILLRTGGLQAGGPGLPVPSEDEQFEAYQRAALELQPVAQIEAWLGYLRLHPDSKQVGYIRARLRFQAAGLTPAQDEELLAILTFQQLPYQLVTLETLQSREEALRFFATSHPRFLEQEARRLSLAELAHRAGVADADAFVASLGKPSPPTGLATAAPPFKVPPTPAAAPTPAPGESVTGSSPGSAPDLATSASPTASAATPAGAGSPGETTPPSSQQPSDGPQPVQVAAIPGGTASSPQPPDPLVNDAEQRYARWLKTTKDLPPDSARQLWLTYLLLYPEDPRAGQAREWVARLEQQGAGSPNPSVANTPEYQALQEQLEAQKQLLTRHRRGTTLTILAVGFILLLIAIAN